MRRQGFVGVVVMWAVMCTFGTQAQAGSVWASASYRNATAGPYDYEYSIGILSDSPSYRIATDAQIERTNGTIQRNVSVDLAYRDGSYEAGWRFIQSGENDIYLQSFSASRRYVFTGDSGAVQLSISTGVTRQYTGKWYRDGETMGRFAVEFMGRRAGHEVRISTICNRNVSRTQLSVRLDAPFSLSDHWSVGPFALYDQVQSARGKNSRWQLKAKITYGL